MGTKGDILQNTALPKQAHMLKSAAQTKLGKSPGGLPGHALPEQFNIACAGLIHTRNQVEKSAFASPVGADQGMHLACQHSQTDRVVGNQAAKTLGQAACFEQHSARRCQRRLRPGSMLHRGSGCWRFEPAPTEPGHDGPQSVGRPVQHDQHQQAEDDHLKVAAAAQELRKNVLQLGLEQRDQPGPQYRAPKVARAADHGHKQVFDANVQVKRGRIHKALQVGVKPA